MIASGVRGFMIKKNNKELWNYLQSLGIDGIEVEEEHKRSFSIFGNLLLTVMEGRTNTEKCTVKKDITDALMIGFKLSVLLTHKGFPRLLFQHAFNTNPASGEPTK